MDSDRLPADGILKRGMTPSHELMVEWVLQNPGGTLKEMADHFDYSISWLSQVTNTDMFKAQIGERLKDIRAVVNQDVPAKMSVLANLACDRMMEVLQKTGDGELIKDSFDKVMHRYGYAPNAKSGMQPQGPGGPGTQIGTQNNVFYLNQDQFAKVQSRLVDAHALPAPQQPEAQPAQEDGQQPAPANTEKV